MNYTKHSEERAYQRYNKKLNKYTVSAIINEINQNNAIYVSKGKSKGQNIYYCKVKKVPYKIVYNIKDKTIITVLPFDSDEYNKLKKEHDIKKMEMMIESKMRTIKCPKCGFKYRAIPQNKMVQCMEPNCSKRYFQILETIDFCENWIKDCFYRVKG